MIGWSTDNLLTQYCFYYNETNKNLNMLQLKRLSKLETKITTSENHYEYLIAVSTDSLAVCNSKKEIEKIIIQGNDGDAFLCACTDINHFLDCLATLEEIIVSKRNPLNFI